MTDDGTPSALAQVNGIIGTPEVGDSVVIHLEDHHDPYEAALLATITGVEDGTLHVHIDVNGYADCNAVEGITPGTEKTVNPARGTDRVTQTVYTVGKFHSVQDEKQARQNATTA